MRGGTSRPRRACEGAIAEWLRLAHRGAPWLAVPTALATMALVASGFTPLFGGDVRFAIVGGTGISTSTLLRWLAVHTVVLGGGVAGAVALAWRRHRRCASALGGQPFDTVG